jgi:hypothetical protein
MAASERLDDELVIFFGDLAQIKRLSECVTRLQRSCTFGQRSSLVLVAKV